ncbi:MAG: hypothetical protein AAB767_01665 [Patescibacteria group bacterium]
MRISSRHCEHFAVALHRLREAIQIFSEGVLDCLPACMRRRASPSTGLAMTVPMRISYVRIVIKKERGVG